MGGVTTEPAERRRRRAATLVQLDRLREAADSGEDPRWETLTWRSLEELPDWCALDAPLRRERLLLAGAVVLLPAIRRCLRGDALLRLRELIGAARLEALRRRPYRTTASDVELADVAGLERQLLAHGTRALLAEVSDPVARALLFETLSAGAPTDESARRDVGPQAARVAAGLQALAGDEPADSPATTTVRVRASRGA